MHIKAVDFLIKNEKYVFYTLLIINILFLFNSKFHPSMDGPAHLHNSFLLNKYYQGSDFFEQYYSINKVPIPNWTSHILLSILLFFLAPENAERFLILLYIVFYALSFRYFVKQVKPENAIGSVLVFPFFYTFLFYLGFLNFSFSIAFMFLGLAFYLKNKTKLNLRNSIILFCLIFITYFSNIIGFIYLLFLIFLFSVITHFNSSQSFTKTNLKIYLSHIFKLSLVSLLPLICLLVFYVNTIFFPSNNKYSFNELLDWIFDLRSIIIFDYNEDKKYTQVLFSGLLMVFSISFFIFFKNLKALYSYSFMLLFTLFLTFIFYKYIPDGASAGMMSDRLCLMFFVIFISLLISMPIPKNILIFLVCLSVYSQLILFTKNHSKVIKTLSADAQKIEECSRKIKERSIVLPVNLSDNWLEGHFSNYLGVNKELVILENYEASIGWFPLKWNKSTMPKFMLGNKQSLDNLSWTTNAESYIEKKIDYVFLYGDLSKLNEPRFSELKQLLIDYYKTDENSDDDFVKLYILK
jgi:hypothetical protein